MSLKTKAKKSVTITVTIAIILFSCNAWDDYKVRYKDSIRSVEIENVERLRKCRTPKNGYKTYKCPECGTIKYVPFTYKCRLCTSCGTKTANEWADEIHHKLLNSVFRLLPLSPPLRHEADPAVIIPMSACDILGDLAHLVMQRLLFLCVLILKGRRLQSSPHPWIAYIDLKPAPCSASPMPKAHQSFIPASLPLSLSCSFYLPLRQPAKQRRSEDPSAFHIARSRCVNTAAASCAFEYLF